MLPRHGPSSPPKLLELTKCLSTTLGTDAAQGQGQILSNINACVAVQGTIKPTLGPYGGDLLMVDENGKQTITNDGATVMKVHTRPEPLGGV